MLSENVSQAPLDHRYLAALIGGLIFMIYPTAQGHISGGHINVLALYGLPLYALCLLRIIRGKAGRGTVIGCGIVLALTARKN